MVLMHVYNQDHREVLKLTLHYESAGEKSQQQRALVGEMETHWRASRTADEIWRGW